MSRDPWRQDGYGVRFGWGAAFAALAIGPALVPPQGAGGEAAVVAITGGLTNEWTLSLAVPAPDAVEREAEREGVSWHE